jgi:hypothetical protein
MVRQCSGVFFLLNIGQEMQGLKELKDPGEGTSGVSGSGLDAPVNKRILP